VYLGACIKETMRLRPAVVTLARENEVPGGGLDLLGVPIPSGADLALFIYGVHRDPAYWERVEEFLPERFLPVSRLVTRMSSLTWHVSVCEVCGGMTFKVQVKWRVTAPGAAPPG
jgi:cytochrome P450